MLRLWLLGFLLLTYTPAQAASDLRVTIGDESALTFVAPQGSKTAVPKPVKTGLFDLGFVGALYPHDETNPYFLFTGNPCKTCSSERALYLIRPSEKSATPQITSFVQPGKIIDPKSRALVLESRAFYGHCLATRMSESEDDDIYIVFQRERVDRRGMMSSVFIANASSDFLREKLIERGMPSLSRTLSLVKMKKCHEIQGRSRMMVLKPHGLNWRNLQPGEDDRNEDKDGADPASESTE